MSEWSLRDSTDGEALAGCHVELHPDGSVVLVVDSERLFKFASLDALLEQYDVIQGEHENGTMGAADAELQAAQISVAAHVAAMHLRPRAEKALIETRVSRAIERVRAARAHRATFPSK